MLRIYQLENLPVPHEVHVALFSNVTNAADLRKQLIAGNADFEYAFIDATTIVSLAHALAATHMSLHRLLVSGKLRTHNAHSEIVYNLSPTNNITEAFRRFGVSDKTTSLLAIKVSHSKQPHTAADIEKHLREVVQGDFMEVSDSTLARQTDWSKVKKYYKMQALQDRLEDAETEVLGKMVMSVVG